MVSINKLINNKVIASKVGGGASSLGSLGVGKLAKYATALPNEAFFRTSAKIADKFENNPEYSKISKNIADAVLEKTNLSKKGVRVYDINLKNISEFSPCDIEYAQLIEEVANGENAYFALEKINLMNGNAIEANSVIINREKLPSSLLHELGHADNYNNSHFLRFLSKISTVASYVAQNMYKVAALTKKTVSKNGEELSKLQKTQNAIHNSAPAISGFLNLPVLIDEAMASKKAVKWAKQYGASDKYIKELSKNYGLAYATYVSNVFSDIATTATAKASKDKLNEKIKSRIF